jgi:hypothetical protein
MSDIAYGWQFLARNGRLSNDFQQPLISSFLACDKHELTSEGVRPDAAPGIRHTEIARRISIVGHRGHSGKEAI